MAARRAVRSFMVVSLLFMFCGQTASWSIGRNLWLDFLNLCTNSYVENLLFTEKLPRGSLLRSTPSHSKGSASSFVFLFPSANKSSSSIGAWDFLLCNPNAISLDTPMRLFSVELLTWQIHAQLYITILSLHLCYKNENKRKRQIIVVIITRRNNHLYNIIITVTNNVMLHNGIQSPPFSHSDLHTSSTSLFNQSILIVTTAKWTTPNNNNHHNNKLGSSHGRMGIRLLLPTGIGRWEKEIMGGINDG